MIHSRASAGGAPAPRRPAERTARAPAVVQQITFLDTSDLARTADFYEWILGMRLARDQGTWRIYRVSGDANPPYRIDNAFVRDANGYVIEIQRFWEPLV